MINGRYRLIDVLGDGGMARVYRAVDERLGRTVAIKTLHNHYNDQPDFVARFEREARLAASLSHPNIIAVHDIGRDTDTHYIVMEYVEGETLKHLIDRDAPLALTLCSTVCQQICLALDEAHRHGIVHRDVKPENIFLTHTYHVKIGDFGIARALDTPGITSTGTVIGSVHYISPEQAQGQQASAQSDIYALGIVVYEMLTGHVPFVASNALAVAMKHIDEAPLPPSSFNSLLSPAIDAVVLKAIAKDPAQRYSSGMDLSTAFDQALALGANSIAHLVPDQRESPQKEDEQSTEIPLSSWPVVATPALSEDNGEDHTAGDWLSNGNSEPVPVPDSKLSDNPVRAEGTISIPGDSPAGAVFHPERTDVASITVPTTSSSPDKINEAVPRPLGGTWRPPASNTRRPSSSPAITPLPPLRRRHFLRSLLILLLILGGLAAAMIWAGELLQHQGIFGTATTPSSGLIQGRQRSTPLAPEIATSGSAPSGVDVSTATAPPAAALATQGAGNGIATMTASPVNAGGSAPSSHTSVAATSTGKPQAPAQVWATLSIARGVTHDYAPIGTTQTLPLSAQSAYAIARWHGVSRGHTIAFRWSTPDAQSSNFTAPAQWGVAFAQIPLSAVGRYTVDLYADSRKIASQSFTVTPSPLTTTARAAPPLRSRNIKPSGNAPLAGHADYPTATTQAQPPSSIPAQQGTSGSSGTESQAATTAVNYANDVYMQVMNNRDPSNVSAAFGSVLAATNRAVASQLISKHQHWQIHLISMTLSHVTLLTADTALVSGVKTESAVLLSDNGQILDNHGTYTVNFTDLVQQVNGRWRVDRVTH